MTTLSLQHRTRMLAAQALDVGRERVDHVPGERQPRLPTRAAAAPGAVLAYEQHRSWLRKELVEHFTRPSAHDRERDVGETSQIVNEVADLGVGRAASGAAANGSSVPSRSLRSRGGGAARGTARARCRDPFQRPIGLLFDLRSWRDPSAVPRLLPRFWMQGSRHGPRPGARPGTRTRSSTSSACARSTTATATASATSRPHREARLPAAISASPRSGCCRSIPRRCATTATTSPTTRDVHPDFGTLDDFERFVERGAPRAGIRVITELVLNHTSDQHPWFQRARRAPAGSPGARLLRLERHARGYEDARIIFKDFEPSNWAWDPVAKAYFWHRFYSHQPDLNFENPAVHEALLAVVDFWLEHGRRRAAARRGAVSLRGGRARTARTCPRRTPSCKKLRAHIDAQVHEPDAARRGQPVARGRRRLLRRRRRVPHELPLPAHAADVHGDPDGGSLPDRRHPRPDAGAPRQLPVGALPAQPRRAHARDGDRRRARLHVPRLRRTSRRCGSTSASAGGSRRSSATTAARSS